MPRYKRYGYIICERTGRDMPTGAYLETSRNIAFYPNPKLANEHIERIIAGIPEGAVALEYDNEHPFERSGIREPRLNGNVLRTVLIMYPETSLAEQLYTVERWWFEVGRE